MIFFTYTYKGFVKWAYLMIKLPNYLEMSEKRKERYKIIFIDPGVDDLSTSNTYKWEGKIDVLNFLKSLPKNHFFSFDYPPHRNPIEKDLLLLKSWENACRYCWHPQYITAVQFPFHDYWSFKIWFDKYNELTHGSGILSLGSMCAEKGCNEFLKHALDYAFSHASKDIKQIHIYGLNKLTIPYAYKLSKRFRIELSVDSRKWEYYKPSKERPFWFKIYIHSLRKEGIQIES